MSTQVSTKDYENLQEFKHRTAIVRAQLRTQFGETYNKYISGLFDDMMEDLEEFVETVGEESIHDEDLAFDNEDEE